jgi:hypothetical protein
MDAQEHRDRGVGDEDPCQWYRGLPIQKRLLAAALYFVAMCVALFVVLLAAYFALDYFFGTTGDQRGNVAGSLADAAEDSALFSGALTLSYPLQWRLRRWMRGDEQQRR